MFTHERGIGIINFEIVFKEERNMGILREEMENKIDNKSIYIYTLENNISKVRITNFGGIILSFETRDKNGQSDDIVLGYDNFEDYKTTTTYLGAIIGRCANRIASASIDINGEKYELAKNDGNNHLHGGTKGFNRAVWDSEILEDDNGQYIKLSYLSKDGEENYPGNLNVNVEYRLTDENELVINYFAKSDKDTIVNLTNHSYFNLSGHSSGDILNHRVKINSKKITVSNSESIPTGEIRDIIGSPMDFTEFKCIGRDINKEYDQLVNGNGYDHNWIIDDYNGELKKVAEVIDDNSGRVLEVFTTKPGIQFYTGNFLNEKEVGKGGVKYKKRQGLCLETQYFPDSLNHKGFSNVILKAGEEYNHTTIYKVSIKNK